MSTTLTTQEAMKALKRSSRTFYRQRRQMINDGILVEVLPRIGGKIEYLAEPIEQRARGEFRLKAVRDFMRRSA